MGELTEPRLPSPRSPAPVAARIAEFCDQLADDPLYGGEPATELLDIADQCREPLRVAVAGDVSTGKSTLVNALLMSRRAAMAREETTARVTSYRHPDLPRPRGAVPGHEYEHLSFPGCDRFILIDTPGLNSPSEDRRERVTQEMIAGATRAAGSTAVLLYLCKDCLMSAGAQNTINAYATLTAGRIGWGLNVVLVGAKADSIQADRMEIEENLRSEARIPCVSTVAVSQQVAMAARTDMLDETHLDTLRTIARHDDLVARIQYGWEMLQRGWAGCGLESSHLDRLRDLAEAPDVLRHCVSEIGAGHIVDVPELVRAWEQYAGLAALERLLERFTDDADMYTTYSARGRLRRMALRLGTERGGVLRDGLSEIEAGCDYAALLRREAAAILETDAMPEAPAPDRMMAASMLRDPVHRSLPAVARTWQRLALESRTSLTRQVADIVADASLNPLRAKA